VTDRITRAAPGRPVGVVEERARELDLRRLVVVDVADPVVVEQLDARVGEAEQDRGVCRDHELALLPEQLVHPLHEGQLAAQRQGGLGLVQEVEPVRGETVHRDVDERLAVRLLVQRPVVDLLHLADRPGLLQRGPEVEDALGAEEEGVPRRQSRPVELDATMQSRVRLPCGEAELVRTAAALGIQPERDRERLEQRRLPAAVLADEEGDLRIELDPLDLAQRRHLAAVVARGACQPEPAEKWGGRRARRHPPNVTLPGWRASSSRR
jgi:hypothetical protein